MSDESDSTQDENEAVVTPVILVVEDDPLTRKAVSRRLQAEGYEIVAVPSAADALIAAQRLPFHVLVLDLNLVTEDDPFSGIHEGFATLDWLKLQLGDLNFRVVIHTSQTGPSVLKKAEASGVFAFCTKRRDLNNLVECVAEAVDSLRAA
jgi:two-component system response regulator GlrR